MWAVVLKKKKYSSFAKNISPIAADENIEMSSDKTSPDIFHWKWSKTYRIKNMSILLYKLTNLGVR